MDAAEDWRPVGGAPGYEVSNRGRVLSRRRGDARLISQHPSPDGHMVVTLYKDGDGRSTRCRVARLVLQAFAPNPEGARVAHRDGDPANNAVANLEWADGWAGGRHRAVVQNGPGGRTVIWADVRAAAYAAGVPCAAVWALCRSGRADAEGRQWGYADAAAVAAADADAPASVAAALAAPASAPVVATNPAEQWAWVETEPGDRIEVSTAGRIRQGGLVVSGRPKGRYLCWRRHYIHSLVARAFCARRPDQTVICHCDGRPANNQASNLMWASPRESAAHMRYLRRRRRRPAKRTRKRNSSAKLSCEAPAAKRQAWNVDER